MVHGLFGRLEIDRVGEPRQHQPGERQHDQRDRQTHEHPAREIHVDIVIVRHEADHEGVGRRAHQRRQTAQRRAIRQAQQQGDAEILALFRRQTGHGLANNGIDRDGDGQEHQGCGGVGDPHADKGRRRHEPRHQRPRIRARECEHAQSDASVKTAAFYRQRHHETAEEQIDDRVRVGRGDVAHGHDVQKGQDDQRQEGGDRHRNGFGRPPDRHPQPQRGHDHARARQALRFERQEHDQGGDRARNQSDPLV